MNRYNLLPSYKYKEHNERVFEDSVGKPLRNYQFTMPDGSENVFGKIYGENLFNVDDVEFATDNVTCSIEKLSADSFKVIATKKNANQYIGFFIDFEAFEGDTFHISFNIEGSNTDLVMPLMRVILKNSRDNTNSSKKNLTNWGYNEYSYTITASDREKYDQARFVIYLNNGSTAKENIGEYVIFSNVMISSISKEYTPSQRPIWIRGQELANPYEWKASAGSEKNVLVTVNDETKDVTVMRGNSTTSPNVYLNLGDYQTLAGKTLIITGEITDCSIENKTCVLYIYGYPELVRSASVELKRIDGKTFSTEYMLPDRDDIKNLTLRLYCYPIASQDIGSYVTFNFSIKVQNNDEKQLIPTHKGYNLIAFKGEQPTEFNFEYYKKG